MHYFQYIADYVHLAAIIFLVYKIIKKDTVVGLSARAQILYLMVFVTRYVDLFMVPLSLYNRVMKLLFISLTLITILLIYIKHSKTYEAGFDTFRIEFLFLPCFVLAIYVNYESSMLELLWAFSIYLEAVAILPQFLMIIKKRTVEVHITDYLITLGGYRGIYLINWAYRYVEEGHYDPISITSGSVQVFSYLMFFVIYTTILEKTPASLMEKKLNVKNSFSGMKPDSSLFIQKNNEASELLINKQNDDSAKFSNELLERLYAANSETDLPKTHSSAIYTI